MALTSISPLLSALNGVRPHRTPIWFMRQAGRSLPEYRQLRQSIGMLEACVTPQVAAEITLQPVRRYGVDGAIFFSDIVTPLYLAGLGVEMVKGRGPVFAEPIRDRRDVEKLTQIREFDPTPIIDATRLIRQELSPQVALLGFAGAPFTLASYLVQNSTATKNKNHLEARALMKSDPRAWHQLAGWCAKMSAQFLAAQIEGGAQAVQLFDSWAGDLSAADYQAHCLPHSQMVLDSAHTKGVRTIHFGVGTAPLLQMMRDAGADCIGVDWRLPLSAAVRLAGHGPDDLPVVQGNLDPAVLFCSPDVIHQQVAQVLEEGRAARAHIVNLGHGVPPNADPEVLKAIVDQVHETGNSSAS